MSGDELTISAAVQRFEVSRKTIRRRLAEGVIEGARQRPGDHGPEWVFPESSLAALGYSLRADDGSSEGADEPPAVVSEWLGNGSSEPDLLAPPPVPSEPPAAETAAAETAPEVVTASGAEVPATSTTPLTSDFAPSDDAGAASNVAGDEPLVDWPDPDEGGVVAPVAPGATDDAADGPSDGPSDDMARLRPLDLPDNGDDRRPWWVVAGLVALVGVLLVGFFAGLWVAGDGDDGGPPSSVPPLEAVLADVTDIGDEIGVVGAAELDGLPPGRTIRALEPADVLSPSDDLPRHVVVLTENAPEVVGSLRVSARTVAALDDGVDGAAWVFDLDGEPTLGGVPTADPGDPRPEVEGEGSTPDPTVTPTAPPSSVDEGAAPTTATSTPVAGPPTGAENDAEGGRDDAGPPAASPGTVTVEVGDHFWSIAEQVVADAGDGDPTQTAVTSYWVQLLDANAEVLVEAGNFDLLLPGQVLELPPV